MAAEMVAMKAVLRAAVMDILLAELWAVEMVLHKVVLRVALKESPLVGSKALNLEFDWVAVTVDD